MDTRRLNPSLAHLVHALVGAGLRAWMRLCFRATVRRVRGLPRGPAVYACNHRSFADPPMIGMHCRPLLTYFARDSLWRVPIVREVLTSLRGIPVDRDNPGLGSMKGAIERLRQGLSVAIFPEGTRTRTGRLGTLQTGPAMIARRAGVPLVPVYVFRTEHAWPRGAILPRLCGPRVEIRFGTPLEVPPHVPAKERDLWLTRRLEAWMRLQEAALLGRGLAPRPRP